MKKVIGIISLLLSVTLATANPIDFDKAFKESANIEKQIKRTSFPDRTHWDNLSRTFTTKYPLPTQRHTKQEI